MHPGRKIPKLDIPEMREKSPHKIQKLFDILFHPHKRHSTQKEKPHIFTRHKHLSTPTASRFSMGRQNEVDHRLPL
ncbi:hypothetical protein CAQU_04055 [Corynebacterium aquilae DSM 44791]|uniref:Uncharacterized protein n=1 Tax=Corynebacterium aquilae DSM 44791 TaxID=1431546 RepID=A0A1L7CEV7_9CORY|nr:hypothetical protein CAQU_04055 [Corynebacterium aquilae DSM 44791]